jgi:hypothetical protein
MKITQRVLAILALLASGLALHTTGAKASAPDPVAVYYNRACGDCLLYIEDVVVPLLNDTGYTNLTYKDYINEPANRTELLFRSDGLGVPPDLQSHLTVFVGDRIILEGHTPEGVVADLLTVPADTFGRILIYQDKMSGATEYVAWAFRGEPQTYSIDTPIGEYLAYLEEHGETEQAQALMDDLRRAELEAVAELRRIIGALRPIYLEGLGFLPALETLVQQTARQATARIRLEQEGRVRRLAPEVELAAYRIAQEALNNALM